MSECSGSWGYGKCGTRRVSMYLTRKAGALNRTSLRTEGPCTNRRAFRHTPSISHYVLRRCRSSILSTLTVLLSRPRQRYYYYTVAYEDEHHHVAPCHWNPAVVHYIKKGHILQTVRCTLISPTDSIASLTYNGAPFWKQRIKALTRLPSHTHSRPRPLWNA